MAFELEGDGTGASRDWYPDDLAQMVRDKEKLGNRAKALRVEAKALTAQGKLHAKLAGAAVVELEEPEEESESEEEEELVAEGPAERRGLIQRLRGE